MELDLVDPLAVAVVRAQTGRMLVREPAPLEGLAAQRPPERDDLRLPRRAALAAQPFDERCVLLVKVVVPERRRLIGRRDGVEVAIRAIVACVATTRYIGRVNLAKRLGALDGSAGTSALP